MFKIRSLIAQYLTKNIKWKDEDPQVRMLAVVKAAVEVFPDDNVMIIVLNDKGQCSITTNSNCPACLIETIVTNARWKGMVHKEDGRQILESELGESEDDDAILH